MTLFKLLPFIIDTILHWQVLKTYVFSISPMHRVEKCVNILYLLNSKMNLLVAFVGIVEICLYHSPNLYRLLEWGFLM